jgi:MFS family permease
MLQRMAPASLASTLAWQYGLSWAEVGLFSSVYLVVYLLLQIPAGIATDRFGARNVLRWSIAVSAMGSLVLAVAPSYAICLAGRAIAALGDALVFSALIKATASHFPKNRFALMMSVAQMAGYAGTGLASTPLLFFASKYGLSSTFLSCALVLAVLFAIVSMQMPKVTSTVAAKGHMSVWNVLSLCAPTLVAFAAYYVAYMMVFASWGTVLLTTGFLLGSYVASSVVLAGVLGLVVGGLVNGALIARGWRHGTLLVTFAVAGSVLFCIVLVAARYGIATPIVFSICFALIGVCFGGISNGLTVTVRERVQTNDLSFASSIHAVFANVAAAVLMPIIGSQLVRPAGDLQILFISFQIGCLLLVVICAVHVHLELRRVPA